MNKSSQKLIIGLILGITIFSIVLPILFFPKPAQAFAPDVVIVNTARWIWDKVQIGLDYMWKVGGGIAYRNGLNMFLSQVASESASWIATGGKEGQPLFFTSGDYWAKMGDSLAADWLDKIAKDFVGFSVCEPIDPTIKLNILLSLPVPKPSPAPFDYESNCSLSNIRENILNVQNSEIAQFSLELKPGGRYNKFSTQLGTMIDAGNLVSYFKILRTNFENSLKTIKEYTNNASQIFKQAQSSSSFTQNQFSQLRAELEMDALENEIEFEAKQFKDSVVSFDKVIKSCEGLSHENFCSRDECLNFCRPLDKPVCATSEKYFQNCLDQLKAQKKYLVEIDSFMDDIYVTYVKTKEGLAMGMTAGPTDPNQAMKDFEKATSGDNPIGTILTLSDFIRSDINQKTEESKFLQLLRGEWKAPETLISGVPFTPAGMTAEEARKASEAGTASAQVYTGVAVADAIGTFTQTLFSKLQKTLMQGFSNLTGGENKISFNSGTWDELFKKAGQNPPVSSEVTTPGGSVTKINPSESPIQGLKTEELKAIYTDALTTPLKKGGESKLIDEFSNCPSDPRYALPNNCVVDTSFARAVEQEMTIEEAMQKNYLHGEWYVSAFGSHQEATTGSSGVSTGGPNGVSETNGIDTKRDFSSRYSYNNIKILTQAGIVPLGLQIATEKISRGNLPEALKNKKFTLKEIVDGFYVKDSPFYHLVSPQWRLKDFPHLCQMTGYIAIPNPQSSDRQETCLQTQDCTSENEDGSCNTWNYCTGYKNAWRFNADVCQLQYNSCQKYTRTSDKTKFAWLDNTLNKNCDASGVGCQWYCQSYNKNFGGTESWDCAAPNKKSVRCEYGSTCNLEIGCNCRNLCTVIQGSNFCLYPVDDVGNTIFLNRLAETCSAGSQGCAEFIRTKENLGTNLLANSSFETYIGTLPNSAISGWEFSENNAMQSTGQFILDEIQAMVGKVYAQFNQAGNLYLSSQAPNIDLLDGTKYAISFYARNIDVNSSRLLKLSIGTTISNSKVWTLSANSSWQLLLYEFTLPIGANKTIKDIKFSSGDNGLNGDNVLIDYLKLEVGKVSSYQDYGTVNLAYFKKAPDYLSCYDNDLKNDDPSCLNFVQACDKEEVGCEKYTPTNGDPYIPAVAKDVDACPAECAGYDNFKERATDFYADRDVTLIPRTASVCSASDVGCEGYTNLEEVGRGGEGREFYSYVRACQKPDGSCGNFYTWVGSETSGFELKKYTLRKDADGSPATILDRTKAEEIWGQCQDDAEQGPIDIRTNPNCKEFYSENGNEIYYQLYKNTIVCNDLCLQLRKNKAVSASACWPSLFKNNVPLIDGLSFNTTGGENCEVGVNQKSCLTPKGEVCDLGRTCPDSDSCTCQTGICTLTTLPSESIKCSSANEGCREYKGNDANNIRVSFMDDFENGTVYPWQPLASSSLIYSNDSVYFGGHSLKIRDKIPDQGQQGGNEISGLPEFLKNILGSKEAQAQAFLYGAERPVDGLVYTGKFYLLSFLVKGANNNQTISAKFSSGMGDILNTGNIPFPNVIVRNDWQVITIGPVYFNKTPNANEKIQITSGQPFWLDNIQLKDTGSLYLIKNSWQTPTTCDLTTLGCSEYRNSANQTKYFKSFSQICSERVVGCEALINTQNSTSPFEEKFNTDLSPRESASGLRQSASTDDVTISADQTEYLVYNKDFSCASADKGCQKLGLPNLTESNQVTTWSDVLLKNNPDDYTRKPILCHEEDQGCEEFTSSGGGVTYLKDPGAKECEWKDKTVVDSGTQTGWFKKGTSQPCYAGYYFPVGVQGIRMSSDLKYDGYAGTCPANAVGCRKFIDPQATGDHVNPGQQQGEAGDSLMGGTGGTSTSGSYYYLDNFKINKSACNGKVSLEKGCVLLDDDKGGGYLYNSTATYDKSEDLNGELIAPISCDKSAAPFTVDISKKIIDNCQPGTKYEKTDYCLYCVTNKQIADDTNLIVKVDPTRVCGEWLHCEKYNKTWVKEISDYIEICDSAERCNRQVGQGKESTCVSFVSPIYDILTEDVYKTRDTSWFGLEPGGYSLYGIRPVERLQTNTYNISPAGPDVSFFDQLMLTHLTGSPASDMGVSDSCSIDDDCPAGAMCLTSDGTSRTPPPPQGQGICLIPLTPQAYPETNAPFNPDLASIFANVNVCEKGHFDCGQLVDKAKCDNNKFAGCQWFTDDGGYCTETDCSYWEDHDYNEFKLAGHSSCNVFSQYCKWDNNHCYYFKPSQENEKSWQYFACQGKYKKAEYGTGGGTIKYFNQNVDPWPGVCTSGKSSRIGESCRYDNIDDETNDSWMYAACDLKNGKGQCELLNKVTNYYGSNNFCLAEDISRPNAHETKACLLWYPFTHVLLPKVETKEVTTYTSLTATLKGYLYSFGGVGAVESYFESCASTNVNDCKLIVSSKANRSLGEITYLLTTDLQPATTYYFRACANSTYGFSCGIIRSFKTATSPNFDFTLSLNPDSAMISQGTSSPTRTIITVEKTNIESRSQLVEFRGEVSPPDSDISVTYYYGPSNCTPEPSDPQSSGISRCIREIGIDARNVDPGQYTVKIKGTAGGIVRYSNDFILTVMGTCGTTKQSCYSSDDCKKSIDGGGLKQFYCIDGNPGTCENTPTRCTKDADCPKYIHDFGPCDTINHKCVRKPEVSCNNGDNCKILTPDQCNMDDADKGICSTGTSRPPAFPFGCVESFNEGVGEGYTQMCHPDYLDNCCPPERVCSYKIQ